MAELVIENAKVIGPTTIEHANIVIDGGKIVKITKQNVEAEEAYDACGLYVIPGLIDAHVHFREPGDENKEDWKTGSQAAAAGGVTTVLDMPNNKVAITSEKLLEEKREIAAKKSIVNFGLYFCANDHNLEEAKKVKNIAGVKFFMGSSTGDIVVSERSLSPYLKVLKERDILAAFHCEKAELLSKYKTSSIDKFGKSDYDYFSDLRPAVCEAMSIRDVSKAMRGNRIHICHVTSDMGLQEIKRARALNENISCEVTPQHLFLTKEDEKKQGAFLKMYPPLRSKFDQTSLWFALRAGLIDIVSTDHAPHTKQEKEMGFELGPGGVPGIETRLPLVLDTTDVRGLIATCSKRPAEIFGIPGKGSIAPGYDADIVLIDPKEDWVIKGENLFTKCKWTPFEGMKVVGKVKATFVGGKLAYDGEQVMDVQGKEIKFSGEK
jgi:dihydroorotase (multifunctional complex type)